MDKPITMRIKETRQEIIKLVNTSDLPAFIIANLFREMSAEIQQMADDIAKQEEAMYLQALSEEKKGEE